MAPSHPVARALRLPVPFIPGTPDPPGDPCESLSAPPPGRCVPQRAACMHGRLGSSSGIVGASAISSNMDMWEISGSIGAWRGVGSGGWVGGCNESLCRSGGRRQSWPSWGLQNKGPQSMDFGPTPRPAKSRSGRRSGHHAATIRPMSMAGGPLGWETSPVQGGPGPSHWTDRGRTKRWRPELGRITDRLAKPNAQSASVHRCEIADV